MAPVCRNKNRINMSRVFPRTSNNCQLVRLDAGVYMHMHDEMSIGKGYHTNQPSKLRIIFMGMDLV